MARNREAINQDMKDNLAVFKMALEDLKAQVINSEAALDDGDFTHLEFLNAARAAQQAAQNLQKLQKEAAMLEEGR